MRLLRNLYRWLGFGFLIVFWYACSPEAKHAESDAATCHVHLTNAIHAQPSCPTRVAAANQVATTDPACIAAGVKPTWNCDAVNR